MFDFPSGHWLAPMLAPNSIVLVGASNRQGTVGAMLAETVRRGGFTGQVFCVNPRYTEVGGYPCLNSIADLPIVPDVAVLSVAAQRMENLFHETIRAGIRAVVVFDPCFFAGDTNPPLLDRLKSMARESNIPVCGGNGMGFVNMTHGIWLSFQVPTSPIPGGIAAICHSGSVFSLLVSSTRRYRFNLVVSSGQEINATVADYIDYAVDLESTRVIALFIESIRDPDAFVAAAAKAHARRIPIVVTKVGRTALSASLAETHSAAIVGSDSAFDALCNAYDIIRCSDIDDLMATAQVLSQQRKPGPGGIGIITDSGGLREQLIDIADAMDVPLPQLASATVRKLQTQLDYGLQAVNPLDVAGPLNREFQQRIRGASIAFSRDPGLAIIAHEMFVDDNFSFYTGVIDDLETIPDETGKPHVLICSLGAVENVRVAERFQNLDIPVINGLKPALRGLANALKWRDRHAALDMIPALPSPETVTHVRTMLLSQVPDEWLALQCLKSFGVPVAQTIRCSDHDEVSAAALEIGFPVVLKTAEPDIVHKSIVGGVIVGLDEDETLRAAYRQMSGRLGPRVVIAEQVPEGIELAFGMVHDLQFGPIVMVSAGGTLIESLDDRAFLLPPFGTKMAENAIRSLRISSLLDGGSGRAPYDIAAVSQMFSNFSMMVDVLCAEIDSIDVNPVIVNAQGAIAVDAVFRK